MTILGRLGTAVMKGITALPPVKDSLERHKRVAPILRAAQAMAYRDVDDEAAKTALTGQLKQSTGELAEALQDMTRFATTSRDDYIHDRAYRLLAASASGTGVAPPPPERSVLFAREESLGRMPISQAFAVFKDIEPRLLDVERKATVVELEDNGSLPPDLRRRLGVLVGGGAERDDELLRSTLASSTAQHYLRVLAGDSRCGPPDMPFFDNPRKSFSVTIPIRRSKHATRE